MARGWGRSEEDLQADKEQARAQERLVPGRRPPEESRRIAQRRTLELSLARIEEQLSKIKSADRRRALEAARSELMERLEALAAARD